MTTRRLLAATVLCSALAAQPAAAVHPADEPTVSLRDGWHLRSAEGLGPGGAEISRPGFATAGWTAARLPTTVLAALVAAGEYPDPYHGKNLEAIPVERFAVPWWYRTEIELAEPLAVSSRLVFHGVNYSAEVWLNGERIVERGAMTGAFRVFDLDVTGRLKAGANALAIQVFPPEPGDFTIGFVDWNPVAPDRNMGVWREVELRRTGAVSLEDVFVRTDFEGSSPATADVTVEARLVNRTGGPASASLEGRIGDGERFAHRVDLGPGEERLVRLTAAEAAALRLRSPRLWWPNNLGEPHLYRLELAAATLGDAAGKSDRLALDFGVREVGDYLDEKNQRGYTINGKPVLVRGGGWVDDLLLADSDQKLEDQILYAKHLNLNTIRLEGFWGSTKTLYELADRHGIMVWVGWSCQWEWEDYLRAPVDPNFGGVDTPAEMELVTVSLRDQVLRLRNHPSIVVWNLASDMLPHPDLERKYRVLLGEIDPTRPPLAACSVRTSEVSGPSGVKMNGPYEWVPPQYWYVDTEHGGAYGFNTETGPGAQPPVVESIRRMMPREDWWPIDDDMWPYHSGRNEFKNPDRYVAALDARYGKSSSLEEFARKAQVANYEAMRPMFEAFSVRRPDAKGVVQWMLNSAWPDLFWQLYDWYLVPTGAYYAARIANQPLHVVYDYGTRQVWGVNDTREALRGATVRVRAFDTRSRQVHEESRPLELAAESRAAVTAVPELRVEDVLFLDLRVEVAGEEVARNFYWLPAKPDVLDWADSKWFYTPTKEYADLTAVTRLPPAPLEIAHAFRAGEAGGHDVEVTLRNPGDRIAFFVELAVLGVESGALAAPIRWDDNYVSLLPGERRTVRGHVPAHALGGDRPVLRVQGMNVPPASAAPAAAAGSGG